MKHVLTLLFFGLAAISYGQNGGLFIRFTDHTGDKPVMACASLKLDPTTESCADVDGRLFLNGLKIGPQKIVIRYEDTVVAEELVVIQPNQLYQLSMRMYKKQTQLADGSTYDVDPNSVSDESANRSNSPLGNELLVSGVKFSSNTVECKAVMCVAYSKPLINHESGAIGHTILREDVANMPLRSATSIAGTVPGVYTNEATNTMNFRGARSDANTYYLDGMRVRSVNQIPKSYIGSVRVYNGGVPANYGDVTGGIIAVESRSIEAEWRKREAEQLRNERYIPMSPTPAASSPGVPEPMETKPFIPSTEPFPELERTPIEEKTLNLDRFLPIYENNFLSAIDHPSSTFGIDVDRASWTYVKNQYLTGYEIKRDAVKMEEMINAFEYSEVEVPENELMQVKLERSACSWNEESELVTVHLRAMDLPEETPRKPHNFVFLIDVSGSMSSSNKLGLLQRGLSELVECLMPGDRVSIVTYAGNSGVVLEPTLYRDKTVILEALKRLRSGGSTNGIGGIKTAYNLAEKHFNPDFNNRIILCTDGDFNVGISTTSELERYIATKRGQGIYLTALGFGMGNYRNDILETLADRGDGNHFYINNIEQSRKVLVDEIGNLINLARDVKLNVEFNPDLVSEYRLIGYENRLLKPRDFTDDTKDAGEIGYGHRVTAIYEIKRGKAERTDTHFTKSKQVGGKRELAYVRLRYKSFEDSASVERQFSLPADQVLEKSELLNLVAAFGLTLRDSAFKGTITKDQLRAMAKSYPAKSEDEKELRAMILKLK